MFQSRVLCMWGQVPVEARGIRRSYSCYYLDFSDRQLWTIQCWFWDLNSGPLKSSPRRYHCVLSHDPVKGTCSSKILCFWSEMAILELTFLYWRYAYGTYMHECFLSPLPPSSWEQAGCEGDPCSETFYYARLRISASHSVIWLGSPPWPGTIPARCHLFRWHLRLKSANTCQQWPASSAGALPGAWPDNDTHVPIAILSLYFQPLEVTLYLFSFFMFLPTLVWFIYSFISA